MTDTSNHSQEEHPSLYSSWRRILTSTHHTDIGHLYLVATLFFFFLGGIAALWMRTELTRPTGLITSAAYNSLFTMHGTNMIFLWIIPAFAAFANYFLPKYIGANDMYYPKLNALSFWLLPVSAALMWLGMPNVGWTGYAPLSVFEPSIGIDMWILGLHVIGISSMIGAFNFIVTVVKLRKPGVTYSNMSLFVWSVMSTSFLVIAATPVLSMALALLLLDRNLGTSFFVPEAGGDPILWQHLFWFYSHPAVYIMILPGMGLVSVILANLARKEIYGYKSMAVAMAGIGIVGFGVWAHHMFTTGMSISARLPFMFMTMIVAVPSGIKVFNWLATLYGGSLKLNTPMWFSISFVASFIVAGVTGVFLASIPVDYALQDTYWVVSHLHFMLLASSTQAVFASIYYYYPYLVKRMYNESFGKLHLLLTNVGVYTMLLSMAGLGLSGMPRRVFDYYPEFLPLNIAATVGGFLIGIGSLLFLYNIINSWYNGEQITTNDPWDLEKYNMQEFP